MLVEARSAGFTIGSPLCGPLEVHVSNEQECSIAATVISVPYIGVINSNTLRAGCILLGSGSVGFNLLSSPGINGSKVCRYTDPGHTNGSLWQHAWRIVPRSQISASCDGPNSTEFRSGAGSSCDVTPGSCFSNQLGAYMQRYPIIYKGVTNYLYKVVNACPCDHVLAPACRRDPSPIIDWIPHSQLLQHN